MLNALEMFQLIIALKIKWSQNEICYDNYIVMMFRSCPNYSFLL